MPVIIKGRAALALIAAVLLLPPLLAPGRSPAEAEQLIKGWMRWQVSQSQMAERQGLGIAVPDSVMAVRWLADLTAIDSLRTDRLRVRKSFIAPPLRRRFAHVVEWTRRGPGQQPRTEYYKLRGGTIFNVRPSARIWWQLHI